MICLAQLTVLLDNTVLNVAIPSLTRELNAATADIQWMINAYSLVRSGLLLTAGSAADRYGRRRTLITGPVLFGAGSPDAGLAGSAAQPVAARAGMGVDGALLLITTLAVVMQIFARDEQPRAIGVWSAVNALGFAAGPLIGGFVLDHFWWGAVFLINLPVAALALVAVVVLVPESKNPQGDRPDLLGALLSTIGMAALVFAVVSGPSHGWTPARVLGAAAVAAALSLFAYWENRIPTRCSAPTSSVTAASRVPSRARCSSPSAWAARSSCSPSTCSSSSVTARWRPACARRRSRSRSPPSTSRACRPGGRPGWVRRWR